MEDWFMKINGVIMPNPVECPITEFDLDSEQSGRSEDGHMHRDRIRANVGSYDPEWQNLTWAELTRIRNAILPASFTVELNLSEATVVRRMAAGDRHWTPKKVNGKWRFNLSVQFTED